MNFNNQTLYKPIKTNVHKIYPVDFQKFNFKKIGYFFIIFSCILPIFISLIFYLSFKITNPNQTIPNYVSLIFTILQLILMSCSFVFLFQKKDKEFIYSSAIGFFSYFYSMNLVGLFLGIIFNSIGFKGTTSDLITTIVANLTALLIALHFSPNLLKKIKITFLKDWKHFIIILLIFGILTYILSFAFGIIQSKITPNSNSNNQNALTQNVHVWYNALFLFILTILTAPLIEEIAIRHSMTMLSGNKWIGLFSSFIYFAFMHIQSVFDWSHITGYLGVSLGFTILYYYSNFNFTYTWICHAIINFISFVIIIGHK